MKTLNRALFAFSLALTSSLGWAVEPLDRVVAIVEQNAILSSDVDNRLNFLRMQADARGQSFPEVTPVLRARVLDRLIEEAALRDEARALGFSVSDEQVNEGLGNLARGLGIQGGLPQLARFTEIYNLPFERLRASTETDLLINAARQRAIQTEIQVSDQEAQALIEREGLNLGQVRLAQLFVRLPQAPTPDQLNAAIERIEGLKAALDQGADFATLARENSDGPEAINGGDLGWREISGLSEEYRRALAQTDDRAITNGFRTRAGLHILKLNGQRSSDTQLIEEVRTRHILLKPNAVRDVVATRDAMRKLANQIENGADFARLAEEFSEDPISASRGGELGWSQISNYVPEFADAVAQLEPGQRSGLVQTQFGWHVIELLDRRQTEQANLSQLQQAKNIIVQRQADEVAAAWSRRILNGAFIERL